MVVPRNRKRRVLGLGGTAQLRGGEEVYLAKVDLATRLKVDVHNTDDPIQSKTAVSTEASAVARALFDAMDAHDDVERQRAEELILADLQRNLDYTAPTVPPPAPPPLLLRLRATMSPGTTPWRLCCVLSPAAFFIDSHQGSGTYNPHIDSPRFCRSAPTPSASSTLRCTKSCAS